MLIRSSAAKDKKNSTCPKKAMKNPLNSVFYPMGKFVRGPQMCLMPLYNRKSS